MSWENNYLQFKANSNLDSIAANQIRQSSFERFLKTGLPSRKEEAWKYTGLTDFKSIDWKPVAGETETITHEHLQQIAQQLPLEFFNLVFINGLLNSTLSNNLTDEIQINEVEVGDFNKADQHVESHMLNLAEAFFSKKLQITLKKNQIFEKPLHVLFVQSSKSPQYLSQKVIFDLGENSEVTVIVHTLSLDSVNVGALNINMQISLADSARMKFIQLQNEDLSSFQFSQTEVSLESKAHFQNLVMSLGSALTRNYFHIDFKGRQASAAAYGLTILDAKQHVDNYTFIQHSIGENESVQHYKSILSGSSQSVFRGRVRIEPNAAKANSSQLNNNLLLTREAQANSIPQLEIYNDDVKAGHGSTIGQLNKDEIFYFLSRGINQYEAVKMLSYGYAKELIAKFENEYVEKYLTEALYGKLERMIQNV